MTTPDSGLTLRILDRADADAVSALLAHSPALHVEGVERGGQLLGVAAAAPPGHCQPSVAARRHLLMRALSFGPAVASRLWRWNRTWARHDPVEPYVHLGLVSVDRQLRGEGLGTLLPRQHVRALDAAGACGNLETNRPEAVGFYRRFGYVVAEEATVLGVPCWFRRRPPG